MWVHGILKNSWRHGSTDLDNINVGRCRYVVKQSLLHGQAVVGEYRRVVHVYPILIHRGGAMGSAGPAAAWVSSQLSRHTQLLPVKQHATENTSTQIPS